MKNKTSSYLLVLSLLLSSPIIWAQDESSDDELQSLLDSAEESGEISVGGEAPPQDEAVIAEPISSETVDVVPPSEVEFDNHELLEDMGNPFVDYEGQYEPAPVEASPQATPPSPVEKKSESKAATIQPSPQPKARPKTETAVTAPKKSETPADELEALKSDMESDDEFKPATDFEPSKTETVKTDGPEADKDDKKDPQPAVFDVGREERDLLAIAQNISGQISDTEWNEVATATKVDSYTVVNNDWLFKISKKLFGSGFFYPKIWSLNSYITNPHFIEPGMVLSFTTGSGSRAPEVKLGSFNEDELNATPGTLGNGNSNADDLANFGEDARPAWLDEKARLTDQGIYFQYASEETMEDLTRASKEALNREYDHYEPPRSDFDIIIPKNYDKNGFDKNSKIFYSFKEGFYLSTFVSTNIVQDFGSIVNGPDENIYFTVKDRAYVQFDASINALPGDKYSVYSAGGKVKHPNSDREGYKYSIVGQIKLIRKIQDKWEVEFIEVSGTPQRGDRLTVYTPKIERITRTFNSRLVEAAILSAYQPMQTILSFGDVVYVDRGRADGVEMGNVFEVYGFKDRLTNRNITSQPTYKMGELTVITLTDNFATAIVTNAKRDFYAGDIALTKTKEAHMRELRSRDAKFKGDKELIGGKALDELDVELNLENLNDDLLKSADKIQLTEDELAELERQEREKSVIKDSERDLKALERLENEIEQAETILNNAKLDEDKLLENENLNDVEKKLQMGDQESLDEIESNLGKRYVDEDLNAKENPYGLTEFDIEEVDELLNIEKDGEEDSASKSTKKSEPEEEPDLEDLNLDE